MRIIPILITVLLYSCGPGEKKEQAIEENQGTALESMDKNEEKDPIILFFGNSLTAGYGLEEGESFPALIQDKIDSLGLSYTTINAGLSGETSSGGRERIDWVLRNPISVFVLELGPNDMLRGLDLDQTETNLRAILDTVRVKSPRAKIIIAGMQAPPNMGSEYAEEFSGIYPKLAEEYDARLIPFLLEGVAGNPELNLPDAKHPNAEGQKMVADNVWQVLKEEL